MWDSLKGPFVCRLADIQTIYHCEVCRDWCDGPIRYRSSQVVHAKLRGHLPISYNTFIL